MDISYYRGLWRLDKQFRHTVIAVTAIVIATILICVGGNLYERFVLHGTEYVEEVAVEVQEV